MRIAIATSAAAMQTPEFDDDERLAEVLRVRGAEVERVRWDADVGWGGFDLVVVRSTWDYTWRLEAFLAWADSVGSGCGTRRGSCGGTRTRSTWGTWRRRGCRWCRRGL